MKSILSNILFAIIMLIVSYLYFISYYWFINIVLKLCIAWFNSNEGFVKFMIFTFIGTPSLGILFGYVAIYFLLSKFIFKRFSKNSFTKVYSIIIFTITTVISILYFWTQFNTFAFMDLLEFILISIIVISINGSLVMAGSNEEW